MEQANIKGIPYGVANFEQVIRTSKKRKPILCGQNDVSSPIGRS